jgi:hypothetical protein
MNSKYSIKVEEDPETGDAIIQFPDELLKEVGWVEGDTINWESNGDGSFVLTKKEIKEWVLVECVSTFRTRYMCEVPKGKKEWALDTVSMEEAKEFSSQHIGEQIISHRVVTEEEALKLFDEDNDYISSWPKEKKMETAFTFESDIEFNKKHGIVK